MKDSSIKDFVETMENDLANVKSYDNLLFLFAKYLNFLMQAERDIFLNKSINNKSNGFYERQLTTFLGNLNINVPRDRKGDFRPAILPPPWQKFDDSFQNILFNLILHSYSPNKIKSLLNSLNLPYSPEEIDQIKDDLYSKSKELSSRELPSDAFALFIDAYHTDIKDDDSNKVKKAVIFTVVGVDLKGYKDIYGFYTFFGSESKENWLVILNDLINRGLKRVLLIVSDDFPGLTSAISTLFPNSDHQLCFIHLQRNIRKNMSKTDAKNFLYDLKSIKLLNDYDKALSDFQKLCSKYENKYPSFIKSLISKKEFYFNFLKYPKSIQKLIYTTNTIENLNSRYEVVRVNSGGYFQSVKTLEVALYVVLNKIRTTKWKKPLLLFKEVEYDIIQMFNLRFFPQTHFA